MSGFYTKERKERERESEGGREGGGREGGRQGGRQGGREETGHKLSYRTHKTIIFLGNKNG